MYSKGHFVDNFVFIFGKNDRKKQFFWDILTFISIAWYTLNLFLYYLIKTCAEFFCLPIYQFYEWLYHFSKVLNKNYCFVCNALNYSLKYYYYVCYKKRKVALLSLKKPTKKLRMMPFPSLHFPPELMKKCVHTTEMSLAGGLGGTRNLGIQLTQFQPGRADYAHQLLLAPALKT